MSESLQEATRVIEDCRSKLGKIRDLKDSKTKAINTTNAGASSINFSPGSGNYISIPGEIKPAIVSVISEYYDRQIDTLKAEINQHIPGLFRTEEPTRKLEL